MIEQCMSNKRKIPDVQPAGNKKPRIAIEPKNFTIPEEPQQEEELSIFDVIGADTTDAFNAD